MTEYIIIWRANHRDPHVSTDTRDFLARYPTYEAALEAAKADEDKSGSSDYFDFEIFETVNP